MATIQTIPPGTLLDPSSIDDHDDALDDAMAELVRNGLFTITVGETTSFPSAKRYVQMTQDNRDSTSLGDEPGILNGYVAGRPFLVPPSFDDPRAGEKIAWNIRYTHAPDSGLLPLFIWKYRDMASGKLERTIKMEAANLRFKHRLDETSGPELPNNPSNIHYAMHLNVLAPYDIRDTQLLIQRPENDRERERAWMYHSSQRRVRRLATGQTTDAFLGSDIMIEDFLGYNGRIMDMKWTYKGTVNKLMAYFNHNDMELVDEVEQKDGFRFIGFHGKGQCFPNVTWQMRKAYILEAEPIDKRHPLSKRIFYVDAQTFTLSFTKIYDRMGKLWKVGFAGFSHPDHHHPDNRGSGVHVLDVVSMIDLQAQHCTTLQFKSLHQENISPKRFSVQYMRQTGR